MDIFRFNPVSTTLDNLRSGQIVNGITSVMWIERYRDAGEFTITAQVSSDVNEMLAIGSLISHIDSRDIMIVENHEISDSKGEDLECTITGRSLETILEQRMVGANKTFPAGVPQPMVLADQTSSWQAKWLIEHHILASQTVDAADDLPGIVTTRISTTDTETEPREVRFGNLYDAVLEILQVDQLGLRVRRPQGTATTTTFEIHDGKDKRTGTKPVIFSFDAGDITNADYLWTNKGYKNSILVTSKWAQVMIKASSGYGRRVDIVDGSAIDNHLNVAPTGAALTALQKSLTTLGKAVLRGSNNVALSKAQAGKNSKKYLYRTDFEVGDIVLIHGMFNEAAPMRVVEYVEIWDKNTSSGYPTLSTWPEET